MQVWCCSLGPRLCLHRVSLEGGFVTVDDGPLLDDGVAKEQSTLFTVVVFFWTEALRLLEDVLGRPVLDAVCVVEATQRLGNDDDVPGPANELASFSQGEGSPSLEQLWREKSFPHVGWQLAEARARLAAHGLEAVAAGYEALKDGGDGLGSKVELGSDLVLLRVVVAEGNNGTVAEEDDPHDVVLAELPSRRLGQRNRLLLLRDAGSSHLAG